MNRIQELKTDREIFDAVFEGKMTCNFRRNDRDFKPGQIAFLRETKYSGIEMAAGAPLEYTGREILADITHVLKSPEVGQFYGLPKDQCVISLAIIRKVGAPMYIQSMIESFNTMGDIMRLATARVQEAGHEAGDLPRR